MYEVGGHGGRTKYNIITHLVFLQKYFPIPELSNILPLLDRCYRLVWLSNAIREIYTTAHSRG